MVVAWQPPQEDMHAYVTGGEDVLQTEPGAQVWLVIKSMHLPGKCKAPDQLSRVRGLQLKPYISLHLASHLASANPSKRMVQRTC
jgi:hypothetical protein